MTGNVSLQADGSLHNTDIKINTKITSTYFGFGNHSIITCHIHKFRTAIQGYSSAYVSIRI